MARSQLIYLKLAQVETESLVDLKLDKLIPKEMPEKNFCATRVQPLLGNVQVRSDL